MTGAITRQENVVARAPALAMANRFGKYNPEEEKAVRKIDVQGDELTYLRQRREMLRSMTPEQALQVIEFHKDLNVFQALELAKKEGKLIVPNCVHDAILIENKKEVYSAWTGTVAIYPAPDAPLGDKVIYGWDRGWGRSYAQYEISFDVPQQFQGKANCALVMEHPDFEIVPLDDNRFELRAAEGCISLLESFPIKNGWYGCDAQFRIPIEDPKRDDDSKRLLWRMDREYIGFVSRSDSDVRPFQGPRNNSLTVALNHKTSFSLEVALF